MSICRRELLRMAAAMPLGALTLSAMGQSVVLGDDALDGQWVKLPYPPFGRVDSIQDIALDGDDVLWVLAGARVSYWDGQQFQTPNGEEWKSGAVANLFFGGPDRGTYVAKCFTKSRHTESGLYYGVVYRVGRQAVNRIAEFHTDLRHARPRFFVSPEGRLFHWGRGFVAFHTGTGWENIEVEIDPAYGRIVETGGQVHFLSHHNQCITIDADGKVTRRPMVPTMELWGQSETIARLRSSTRLPINNGEDATEVEKSLLAAGVDRRSRVRVFPASDGAVWLAASTRPHRIFLYRVEIDGRVSRAEDTADLLAAMPYDIGASSVLAAADGSLWVGLSSDGTVRLKGDDRTLFDSRTGLRLVGPQAEDSQGRLYSQHPYGICVFHPHRGNGRNENPAACLPVVPEIAWHWQPDTSKVDHAWRIGPWAVCYSNFLHKRGLTVLDAETGRETCKIPTGATFGSQIWAIPGATQDELLLLGRDRIRAIELPAGTVRADTEYPGSYRNQPILIDDRYLIRKGLDLFLIDRDGREISQAAWDDSVAAALDPVNVVQDRGQTVGRDRCTGEKLWSDRTDAWWGSGVVFGKRARYCVEALMWASPRVGESGLIGRDPRTGKRLWEYRQPGFLWQTPLIDQSRDLILAVFERGNAVAISGDGGNEIWHTQLPENPHRAPSRHHEPYWPAISLQDDRLWIVDSNGVLQVLDLDDGRLLASVVLTTALSEDGSQPVTVKMVNMPWRAKDVLVAATELGMAGYHLPDILR
jgi:putative pyrroloquinoline-quinone binding quinoprotein